MEDREMERNRLTHRWFLIDTTMPIVFMSEKVLSYLFIVKSYFSSLLLMHGQTVSRENLTRLEYINILLYLSSIRDYRMLLWMIGMMKKMLSL